MKILIINYYDVGGGASIAAVRLASALNQFGVITKIGVVQKKTDLNFVIEIPKKKIPKYYKIIHKIVKLIIKVSCFLFPFFNNIKVFKSTNNILHSRNNKSIIDINWINNSDFDIVNLHWIGNNMISIKDISKINKPIVWTMHDSWPCCGAEHYQNVLEDDKRYQEGYYKNNKPTTTKGIDLCRKVWKQKRKYLSDMEITFIAPSKWQNNVLKSSALFSKNKCFVVPNIVPKKYFHSINKNQIKTMLGIPTDKKIIGFGAAENLDDPNGRKGGFYLKEALNSLDNKDKYFLIIFGPSSNKFSEQIKFSSFVSGYIDNPSILNLLYNCCDVIICPSIIENLPNICVESICCGVPVVAFDVGGTSDIVVHKETGWLATPYNTEEIVKGIKWCIQESDYLSKNCIKKSEKDFNEDTIIRNYLKIYSSVLKNDN